MVETSADTDGSNCPEYSSWLTSWGYSINWFDDFWKFWREWMRFRIEILLSVHEYMSY